MLIRGLRRILALPTAILLALETEERYLPVDIIAATPASFGAGYIRYAPDDMCTDDVEKGDKIYPNNGIDLIDLLIPTAEERS